MSGEPRKITVAERAAIRKLVISMCANYDRDYGCLPLDGECYMLLKVYTGEYCRYFRAAVLPLAPALEAALTVGPVRLCSICGQPFPQSGKQAYCSELCAADAQRKRNREFMRKNRG